MIETEHRCGFACRLVLYPQMIGVTMKRDLAEIEKRSLSA